MLGVSLSFWNPCERLYFGLIPWPVMILFTAIVINLRVKPFTTRGLNTIEEVTLIASWFTLFGGALLFAEEVSLEYVWIRRKTKGEEREMRHQMAIISFTPFLLINTKFNIEQ